jgi:fibroblast growth factor receptor substrate 2
MNKTQTQFCRPLGSLRRYGFDANFFTFEAGRRCETGAGIFSFKCQRADVLFSTFQSYIQRAYINDETTGSDFVVPNASNRNIAQLNSLNLGVGTLHSQGIQGSSYIVNNRPNSSLSPVGTNSIQSRSTDTLTADYLEPRPAAANLSYPHRFSTTRMGSFGSGHLSPSSPGSPNSYTNILEITNLNQSHHQNQPHGNIYQEYPSGYAQRNAQKNLDIPPAEQAPTVSQLKTPTTMSMVVTAPKNDPSTNVYMNAEIGTSSKSSTVVETDAPKSTPRQATLAEMESLEVEPDESSASSPDSVKVSTATALYMNVAIGVSGDENNQVPVITPPACSYSSETKENQPPIAITPPMLANNLNSKMNDIKKDYTKNVNGNIFGFTRAQSFTQDPPSSATRCYENLDVGNLTEMKPLIHRNARYSRPEIFSKVDLPLVDRTDKSEPCTPTQRKVNYIVLDLDQPNIINNNNNHTINNNGVNGVVVVNGSSLNGISSSNNNNGSADNFSDSVQSQMVNSASASSGLTIPESPKKLGYATIDFDRSNALSNILQNNTINDFDQSCRKTRHDSNVALATMKHSNSMSD